ncbi:iron complex transport system ATP-binding protein [Balnearium lithotrophicum]|uniref:Iron complex transport system ATP-binding protein n=1 Tax=Balnearium lithotrophicum TaxID=223788 RepID=A0A521BW76_9BACT|nr:ABC transporter ATP-binding protein [Balnearium lithotrophicum]SMO51429.1 iron complex transport system ATP-binding protein [Balnearium lithotrophicum]
MVEVRELSFRILSNFTFSVGSGKVVGIVGRNGSGKTTLLRCLGGYHKYTGSVKVEGVEIKRASSKERFKLVNYLPQSFSYFFPYTVLEFLSVTTGKEREETEEVLEELQIGNLRKRFVNTLSGGESVKVQLARLILSAPKVFLLDEPVAFLDVTVYSLIGKLVEKLQREGKTVFITAHDLSFLYDTCDLFLGMEKGKFVFFGEKGDFLYGIRELFNGFLKVKAFNGEVFIKPKGGES